MSTTPHLPALASRRVDRACDRFETAWKEGSRPHIEDYLAAAAGPERSALVYELIAVEVEYRRLAGELPQPDDYQVRFPALDAALLCQVCAGTAARRRLGRFELRQRIGLGGFGTVWRAHDTEMHRDVALKVPHPGLLETPAHHERFLREARAAAQLRHPGIVTVHEVASIDGQPVLVSEFVDGQPLRALLRDGRPTFRDAAALVADVAEALDYAHGMGVVHRDVKPANILLEDPLTQRRKDAKKYQETEEREVDSFAPVRLCVSFSPKLVDFGLALREDGGATLTQEGQLIGTPAYMSPEQASGKGHTVDRRSDVYSLGVVLYELLTGAVPFRGAKSLLVEQILHAEPQPPRRLDGAVPHDLETIALKCLAKEPGRRYPTARVLADDLRRWLNGEPIRARPVSAWERTWLWARRRPAAAALILVTGVAVLALGGVTTGSFFYSRLQETNARLEQEAQRAEKFRYFHHIAVAHAEWRDGDMGLVEPLLDACPPERRGWEWDYLKRLCHADLLTLKGHTDEVSCVAFSPDGKWLASGSYDKTVKIWDVAIGQPIYTLKGHTGVVFGVAFSRDGKLLASASDDKTVKVWDTTTREEIHTLEGHTAMARSPAFSPDGKLLASASHDKTVKVWDLRSGKPPLNISHKDLDQVACVAFSPDGLQLASADLGGGVQVWDVKTGEAVRTLPRHDGRLWSVAFSPDSLQLASAGEGATVQVWDAKTGQPIRTLKGHVGAIHSLAFSSPDGARLASTGRDQTVRVWDMTTGKQVNSLKGHTSTGRGVAFSPDGARLASASNDGTVKIWDVTTDTGVRTLRGHTGRVSHVALRPDGTQLASASWDGTVKVWDMTTGQVIHTLPGHARKFPSVAFSPVESWLAGTGADRTVKIWDLATGHEVRSLPGHNSNIQSVAFSPDGKWLASGSEDGTVIVWHARTGKESFTLRGHSKEVRQEVRSLAFSPDGKWLASGSRDKSAKVWDVTTGQLRRTLEPNPGFVYGWVDGVAFSPDGTRLALACGDFTVRVWEWMTEKEPILLKGHTGPVYSVAFSPDGTRLASAGSDDQTIRVWDVTNGLAVLTLRGHSGTTASVAFSPDGTRLASASYDGTVKVWDARPLTPEVRLEREALSLLDFLFARSLRQEDVIKHLENSQTISDPVRQMARALVVRYREETAAAGSGK